MEEQEMVKLFIGYNDYILIPKEEFKEKFRIHVEE